MPGPYRRLLVPVDGSPTAARGLAEAVAVARACDACIVLLSVVEVRPMMMELATASTWEQVTSELTAHHQRTLDTALATVRAAGLAAETDLEDAAAAAVCDVIVEAARRHRCDLIVMGTHGRRGLGHALIGSDAERVLRLAPCPVLTVRAPDAT